MTSLNVSFSPADIQFTITEGRNQKIFTLEMQIFSPRNDSNIDDRKSTTNLLIAAALNQLVLDY